MVKMKIILLALTAVIIMENCNQSNTSEKVKVSGSTEHISIKATNIISGYTSSKVESVGDDESSPTGNMLFSSDSVIVLEETDTIHAKLGVQFGTVFNLISGDTSQVLLKFKEVWHFPEGMTDLYGNPMESHPVMVEFIVNGGRQYSCYMFEEEHELVKGRWIVETYFGKKLLFKKSYIVR